MVNFELWRQLGPGNLDIQLNLDPRDSEPIGNFGAGDIASCIRHLIVGYEFEVHPLVKRGNERIDKGLSLKEYEWYGSVPSEHRHHLHQARAIGSWLEGNELDTDHFNEARRFLEAWWSNEGHPWPQRDIVRFGLDEYLVLAVLGGLSEDGIQGKESLKAGIDVFERWVGKKDFSLKKALKPRDIGYAMCRHYLKNEFDRGELLQAGHKMLALQLTNETGNGWLDNGELIDAAMWLLAVYGYPSIHFGEELQKPLDILLKIYDIVPNAGRPF